ncbi:MAG: GntR family transcriptional regulator [Hyphomicrobiales bacterium]
MAPLAGRTTFAPSTALKRIRARGPLVEQVYNSLKSAIITGRIAPGSCLHEEPLTLALGVSRTPLREAFNRLKSDGLIEVIPHRGAFVVELEAHDIDNLLEAREVIETAFFMRAARSFKRAELLKIRLALQRSYRQLLGKRGKADQEKALQIYLAIDRDLHDRLIEASENKYWIKLYHDLRERIELCGHQVSQLPHRFRRIVQEHLDLIEALLAGDLARGRQCLRTHIRNVQQGVQEYRQLMSRAVPAGAERRPAAVSRPRSGVDAAHPPAAVPNKRGSP